MALLYEWLISLEYKSCGASTRAPTIASPTLPQRAWKKNRKHYDIFRQYFAYDHTTMNTPVLV